MEQTTPTPTSTKGIPTWLIVVWVIVFLAISFYGFITSAFNGLVEKEEIVKTAWSQVENQYQRRLDLIDNLVNTVKGSANFEKSTLEGVINARASATKTTVDINNVDEIAEFQKQQTGLSQALSRLISVTENYPDLKASQQFGDLMVQLEGTENRIATERGRYNETVQDFNVFARTFPRNMIAMMFGFEQKTRYEAEEGAEKAPKVDFSDIK